MQTKRSEQPAFFDLAVQQRGASNQVLDTIAREVDFTEGEARVAATYSQGGRPATRVGVLLRVVILQQLCGLSDPQSETQINDWLSFQKFLQIDTQEVVPDETTICRFRQRLIECGLHEHLLALLNMQLEARGYIVKRTTLVDATLVELNRQRPDVTTVANGTAPDADASYTRNGGHTFCGYKAYVASDGAQQLIRAAGLTTAKAYDGEVLPQITATDTRAVFGDKAYDNKANRAWLRTHGFTNGILKKEAHHIRLTPRDEADNRR